MYIIGLWYLVLIKAGNIIEFMPLAIAVETLITKPAISLCVQVRKVLLDYLLCFLISILYMPLNFSAIAPPSALKEYNPIWSTRKPFVSSLIS